MNTIGPRLAAISLLLWLLPACQLPLRAQEGTPERRPVASETAGKPAPEASGPAEPRPEPKPPGPRSGTESDGEKPEGDAAPAKPPTEAEEEAPAGGTAAPAGEGEVEGKPSEREPKPEEEPEAAEEEATEPAAPPSETEAAVPEEEAPAGKKVAAEAAAPAPREPRPFAPRPRIVSRQVEQRRDESVRKSLDVVAAPKEKPVSEAERVAALADLVRQARMQLASLQTEHAQFETDWEQLQEREEEIASQRTRLPQLVRNADLPLLYAETTRDEAEETVSDMNDLFDRALGRRAELAEAVQRYEAELSEATQSAEALQQGELSQAWPSALQVLGTRVEATRGLVALLDQIIGKAVEVSETGAQLALELNRAIELGEPRRILARTAAPLSAESLAEIGTELTALRGAAADTLHGARSAVEGTNLWLGAVLTLLLMAVAGALCWEMPRLPDRLAPVTDSQTENSDPKRVRRALELLVPAGRALVVLALWELLVRIWHLSDGWWLAGLYVLGAWTAYFVLNFVLRELFAPRRAEFRVLNLRQEAAQSLYHLLRALAAYTAALLPPIGLLGSLEELPAETMRALQVVYGAGLLLIGVYVVRRAGGLGAVLPRPETPRKTALQQAGQLLLPLAALGVLGGVVAAAGGYSNLSTYLSRSLSLELLVLMPAIFVYNLALSPRENDARWRVYGRWLLWTLVLLAQIPVWQLHSYHATYAFDLLRRSIITVEGAEVSGLTIAKGLLLVLAAYLIGRFLRSQLQSWRYLTERFQAGVTYALSNLVFYLILAAGIVWGILASGFQLSVLTVFAGMAGIGLGFGLQNIVGNFISGLILLIERPVAVGDFVEVSGLQGHITAINLRSTTIRTRDNNVVLVPNSDLASSTVTNLTISDPTVRVAVNVGVSYSSNLALVRDILRRAAVENANVLDHPEPRVLLMDFGSSSVDFVLYAWVADAETAIVTGPELRMQIWDAFKVHGVEIPFPQTDLHIRSSDIPLPGAGELRSEEGPEAEQTPH
jgi:small-conductance mechanosensitive channel